MGRASASVNRGSPPVRVLQPEPAVRTLNEAVREIRRTPMAKFSEIIEYNWTGKVEYFMSMGAQFTKDCGGGICKYHGELWSPNQLVKQWVWPL
jgi:hypothetical protein